MRRGDSLSLGKENSIRILQRHRPVALSQLRLAKLVLVLVNLSLQTWDIVPNFVTITTNQDAIVAIELSQKVAHIPNPPILSTKQVLRLSKPYLPLQISNQNPKYRIPYHCFIRHLMRATAFVQFRYKMKVVIPTMPKS